MDTIGHAIWETRLICQYMKLLFLCMEKEKKNQAESWLKNHFKTWVHCGNLNAKLSFRAILVFKGWEGNLKFSLARKVFVFDKKVINVFSFHKQLWLFSPLSFSAKAPQIYESNLWKKVKVLLLPKGSFFMCSSNKFVTCERTNKTCFYLRSTGLRLIPSEVFGRIRRKQQPKLQQIYKISVATVAAKLLKIPSFSIISTNKGKRKKFSTISLPLLNTEFISYFNTK